MARHDAITVGLRRSVEREVEELARKRGLQIKPSGELAARVFAMFEQRKRFAAIVIDTQQDPEATLDRYSLAFVRFFTLSGTGARADRKLSARGKKRCSCRPLAMR